MEVVVIITIFLCVYCIVAKRFWFYNQSPNLDLFHEFAFVAILTIWIIIFLICPDSERDTKFYLSYCVSFFTLNGVLLTIVTQIKTRRKVDLISKRGFGNRVNEVRLILYNCVELTSSRKKSRFSNIYYLLSSINYKILECVEECPQSARNDEIDNLYETLAQVENQFEASLYNKNLESKFYLQATNDLKSLLSLLNDIAEEFENVYQK